ncbi:hypothetical protein [Arthrobacter nitrophenolicus]|uniref:hypothetical protein n=1 Tax=Arthrobacter nitrophenolicus TaxID=683150 RepID=UPI00034C0CAA|nr:hypothetical protein [Arthrobacter nitrophenolicus]
MSLRRLLGAATAVVILGGFAPAPATAAPALPAGGTRVPAAPSAQDPATLDPAALWKGTPDGFASLPGHGLPGTTGGQAGKIVTATTIAQLQEFASAPEPLVIFIDGSLHAAQYVKIPVAANKSFIGAGAGARGGERRVQAHQRFQRYLPELHRP